MLTTHQAKTLIRKVFLIISIFLIFLAWQVPIVYANWNTSIIRKPILTKFHIWAFWAFLGKLVPKNPNCYFKIKFNTKSKLSKLNMMIIIFSVLDRKYPLWANSVQNTIIVCLTWNLVPSLSWICWIWWRYWLFLF